MYINIPRHVRICTGLILFVCRLISLFVSLLVLHSITLLFSAPLQFFFLFHSSILCNGRQGFAMGCIEGRVAVEYFSEMQNKVNQQKSKSTWFIFKVIIDISLCISISMYSLVYTFSTYMPGVALLPSSNLLYLLNFFLSSSFVAFLLSFLQYWVYIPLDYKYLIYSLALTFIPHCSPLRYFSLISSSSPLLLFFHLFLLSFLIAVLFLSPLSFSLQQMEPRHSQRTLFSNVIEMEATFILWTPLIFIITEHSVQLVRMEHSVGGTKKPGI